MTLNVTSLMYPIMKETKQISNGNYTFDALIPDKYTFTLTNSTGFVVYEDSKVLMPNKNTHQIVVKK